MRLKDYHEKDGKRVWMSSDEVQLLIDNVDTSHPEMKAALLLAWRCGLRRNEIVNVTPTDLRSNGTGQVVRVWAGKGDKYREPPAPPVITELVLGMNKSPDEPIVTVNDSTIYDWVQRAANRCRAQTGDEAWAFVGPHDCRRTYGVLALEHGVLPSVVMSYMGHESWEIFKEHYLSEFSVEGLRRQRKKIPWLAEFDRDTKRGQESYSAVSQPGHSR
jgi:Site-specific recombinase XerD